MKKQFNILMILATLILTSIGVSFIIDENSPIITNDTSVKNATDSKTKIITEIEAPIIEDLIISNYSLGKIGIKVNFDDKGAIVNPTTSHIKIYNGNDNTGILNETIQITEKSGHTYNSKIPLVINVQYYVEVTINTDYNIENPTPIVKGSKWETIGTIDTNITNLKLTPIDNTFGKSDGLIELSMEINQRRAGDVTEIKVSIDDGVPKEIEIPKLAATQHDFWIQGLVIGENLEPGIHKVKVEEIATYGGNLEQNEIVIIPTKEESKPIPTTEIIEPQEAEDGTITYKENDIKITLIDQEGSEPLSIDMIDATNANFRIKDSLEQINHSTTSNVNTSVKDGKVVLALNKDLVISKENVIEGYTIELSGLKITTLGNTNTLTFDVHTQGVKEDNMSGGAIAGIVIGSIAGVALLGTGGYWIFNKKEKISPSK